jgi:hypothetical protein
MAPYHTNSRAIVHSIGDRNKECRHKYDMAMKLK